PFGHTGVARHQYPPWGDGSDATSHTMPNRGVSCHLCDDVVPSFFKNLPQKGARVGVKRVIAKSLSELLRARVWPGILCLLLLCASCTQAQYTAAPGADTPVYETG